MSISRLEIIFSVMFYESKNIFFVNKLKNFEKNTLNNVFCNRIVSYCHLLPILKNDWIIINHVFFSGKIFSTTLTFPIFKGKFSAALIVERIF